MGVGQNDEKTRTYKKMREEKKIQKITISSSQNINRISGRGVWCGVRRF